MMWIADLTRHFEVIGSGSNSKSNPSIEDVRACHDVASLAKMMIEFDRRVMFPSVYRLIELASLQPVATATVESVHSLSIKIIKTELRFIMDMF